MDRAAGIRERAGSSAEGVKAEHLGHTGLLWMFSVPNFQNRLLRGCFTGCLLLATLRPGSKIRTAIFFP